MNTLVRITEVSPRDGLQNESRFVPTDRKAALIAALARSHPDEIEITSFVSPKWVPQLGDADALCDLLARDPSAKPASTIYSALVPNERGMEHLLKANQRAGFALIDKVSVFAAASETFSQRNTNASIAQTMERFKPVVQLAHAHGLMVRGYISCVVACPYEGAVEPRAVASVASQLIDLGIDEIDLGDTIGAAAPESISRVIATTLETLEEAHGWSDASRLTLHLHDTTGRAAACAKAALKLGIRSFDASAAGLGGCPYASCEGRRAPGNIDTLTLCQAIEEAGFVHHIDTSALASAAAFARDLLTRPQD